MIQTQSIPENLTSNEFHQIHFRVHRIEKNTRFAEWQVNYVQRPYTVFWYVYDGEKSIKVNGETYHVQKGDLVVFPAHIPFEVLKNNHSITFTHYELAIESKLGSFDLMQLFKFPVVTKLIDSEQTIKLLDAWDRLKQEWLIQKENPFLQNGELGFSLKKTVELLQFNALTLDWFAEVLLTFSSELTELFPTLDPRFQQLFYFINENLSKKLTLKTLADEVFLSESHLSLLFRKNFNLSPMEYVQMKRMQKAQALLLTSKIPLKEIALFIGFDDQSQLSRAFRRQIGMSPTEYRRKEGSN